jgi:general secretion pathway protein M
MNKLRQWYSALEAREQRMVLIGTVVVGALILFGAVLLPLESAVSTAVRTRDTRREDLAWMQVNAPEVSAGSGSLAPDTGEAPVVLVDRVGRESGLGPAMRGTQPSGTGVRVQLEAAAFDTLVNWLATLEGRYGLAIESISVDRAAKPGLVNANITFSSAKR